MRTLQDDISAVYQIAVAPSSTPLDEASARARAAKIGALVGLDAAFAIYQFDSQTWVADWLSEPGQSCPAPTCIDGVPIDPSWPAIRLKMDSLGLVISFSRTLGPTAPKPGRVISEAQARLVGGGKPSRVQLVWARAPQSNPTFQLAWRLDYPNLQPDGTSLPCVVWLDAGSGAHLDTACVS